jgi:hypothetical protein
MVPDRAAQRRLHEALAALGVNPSALKPLGGTSEAISYFPVRGEELVPRMNVLGRSLDALGWRPVCLGDDQDLPALEDGFDVEPRPPAEILAAADTIAPDPLAWVQRRDAEWIRYLREAGEDEQDLAARARRPWVDRYGDPERDFPAQPTPSRRLEVCYELSDESKARMAEPAQWTKLELVWKDEVLIGLVPTNLGWQVPAYLRFGGWNDCPSPEEHTRIHRSWEADYGSQVVVVTSSTIETGVSRPPTTRSAAIALAQQHFDYCADIVKQGTGTVGALAGDLLDAPFWYFWWD